VGDPLPPEQTSRDRCGHGGAALRCSAAAVAAAADDQQILREDAQADPTLEPGGVMVAAAAQAEAPPQDADPVLDAGPEAVAAPEPGRPFAGTIGRPDRPGRISAVTSTTAAATGRGCGTWRRSAGPTN
jgi:hypothetical protein